MAEIKQILPGVRCGTARIPASKSRAHRLLILGALSEKPSELICNGLSNDILATIDCLNSLGAGIEVSPDGKIHIIPIERNAGGDIISDVAALPCRDSGSTLRFLLPLAGVLHRRTRFEMEGRLPERPLDPYDQELTAHGMRIRKDGSGLICEGELHPGDYTLPGDVSSQYISGLLMALPLLDGDSTLTVTGTVESGDYIRMTEDALKDAQISFTREHNRYYIPGRQICDPPQTRAVEGDWSGAAFFLTLGALSPEGVLVKGISTSSLQGDKAIIDILQRFGADIRETGDGIIASYAPLHGITVDASAIPDLVPVISVAAAAASGTTQIINAARLRLKESDRILSTAQMLTSIGASVEEGPDSLTIRGCGFVPGNRMLSGGNVDSFNDHRIAMSAAVAAAVCDSPVTISDPDCVRKSFSDFWDVYDSLTRRPL